MMIFAVGVSNEDMWKRWIEQAPPILLKNLGNFANSRGRDLHPTSIQYFW
jgi:hypothetical protein